MNASSPVPAPRTGAASGEQPTTWRSTIADLRADAARYVHYDAGGSTPTLPLMLRAVVVNQGLQATALYRLTRLLHAHRCRSLRTRLVTLPGRLLCPVLTRLNDVVNGIWINRDADIGSGLYIAHYGGVVIGPARIGRNCNIGNSVTIGQSGRGDQAGIPVIGDRVSIGAGARVLGRIVIGDDALVGPCSLVVRDVPARAVVLGVPARQVGRDGSFDYVRYPGMETDEPRLRSRALVAQDS